MDAPQMAHLLTELLVQDLNVKCLQVVRLTRASCSTTNGDAIRRTVVMLTNAESILCAVCHHTLSHLGDHFELPELDQFMSSGIGLIYCTPAARTVWIYLLGSAVVRYTR